MSDECAAATASESNMGEGQVLNNVRRRIVLFSFSAASKDIYCSERAPLGVSIVDRKGACLAQNRKRPALTGLFFGPFGKSANLMEVVQVTWLSNILAHRVSFGRDWVGRGQ